MPNCVEAVAAFLAVASLGATWSSCSPDFGTRAVRDRFAQLEPSVFLAVDGYRYGGKAFDVRERVRHCVSRYRGLTATVLVPYLDAAAQLDGASSWAELTAEPVRSNTTRCRSTIRSGSCIPQAQRDSPKGSCTGTAESSSSI